MLEIHHWLNFCASYQARTAPKIKGEQRGDRVDPGGPVQIANQDGVLSGEYNGA